MKIAQIVQHPARLGAVPVAICSEAVAIAKNTFIAANGVWSLLHSGSTLTGMRIWGMPDWLGMASAARRSWVNPTERAYAAASSDYVQDARRVMEALRLSAEEESDDPLASPWDDVVRSPITAASAPPTSLFAPRPFAGGHTNAATTG